MEATESVHWFISVTHSGRCRRLHRIGGCPSHPVALTENSRTQATVHLHSLEGANFTSKCKHCYPEDGLGELPKNLLIAAEGRALVAPPAVCRIKIDSEAELHTEDESDSSDSDAAVEVKENKKRSRDADGEDSRSPSERSARGGL